MKAIFKTIGTIKVNDTTSINVSKVLEGKVEKGIYVNNKIKSEKYNGFSKGIFIPKDKVEEVKQILFKEVK